VERNCGLKTTTIRRSAERPACRLKCLWKGVVSSDFSFWKQGVGDPEEIFDRLAEGDASGLTPSDDVMRFREELLGLWPEMKDVLEPSDFDLEESPEDALKYVLLTLSVRQLDYLPQVIELAKKHGLCGFSGVAGEPMR
jgi:hypothetical protein